MKTLLLIGVHREERAFGEAVAAGLARNDIDVLAVEDGLSGRRPRADQRYRYDNLHRALYRQLPAHAAGRHDILVDLHTGLDHTATSADLICAEPDRLAGVAERLGADANRVRIVALGRAHADGPVAETVIPEEIWRHPAFLYVGIEVFLPETGAGTPAQWDFARRLVNAVADVAGASLRDRPRPGSLNETRAVPSWTR